MVAVSSFYDDFNDNTRDATKWDAYPANALETGGKLRLVLDNNGLVTSFSDSLDLVGSELRFDTELAEGTSIGNNYVEFGIYFGNFNSMRGFRRSGSNINWLSGSTTVAGSGLAYSATAHRYCRVRGVAGVNNTIYWETSPDQVTWTDRYNIALQASTNPLTNGTVFLRVSNYQGSPLSTFIAFNAINPQSIVVPPTGPQVWVWDGSAKQAATAKVWDGTTKIAATPKIAP